MSNTKTNTDYNDEILDILNKYILIVENDVVKLTAYVSLLVFLGRIKVISFNTATFPDFTGGGSPG